MTIIKTKDMRTFVIGDVHGCYRGLLQCLERSGFDKENDRLISIGDIADGWSQVPECVDELLTIKNLVALRGNHDVWCYNWFTYGDRPQIWTSQGGQATIDAYIRTGQLKDLKHIAFWYAQQDYFIDEENRLFVHAGFDLIEGFKNTKQMQMNMRGHNYYHWSRDLAELNTFMLDEHEINNLNEFKEIFIGHTAHQTTSFNKMNVWNIDTGAGWHGKLTIMNVETKEYWQSDPVQTLYPDEKGRR